MSLTEHLLLTSPVSIERATQHPFLLQAGLRTLPKSALEAWLSQDRLYALHGYTRMLGFLLSRSLPRPTLQILISTLANIDREIRFFEDTAAQNNLSLEKGGEHGMNQITRGYVDYIVSKAATASVEETLVFLWAMEILYYKAWSFAQSQTPQHQGDPSVSAALNVLILNWTSTSFKIFLD